VFAGLKRWARALKAQLLALWFSRSHPDMPLLAKLFAGLVVAYAASPIDLIPDFIPVIGYLDDVILVPLGIYFVLRLIPEHVLAVSRTQAEKWMAQKQGEPKSYLAAAAILGVWLAFAWWAYIRIAEWLNP
jgi:uncharacterized membrane protein YkvA (DUF1232 family)